MREQPPQKLVDLLQRIELATASQVGQMAPRVRRLARDLPHFESVWVDALCQARLLTPFQAKAINAGEGEGLRVGPYLLCNSTPWPDYANCYLARHAETGELVRLTVLDAAADQTERICREFESLTAQSAKLHSDNLSPIREWGSQDDRIWAASAWVDGISAAEQMVQGGRFPTHVVPRIARAMAAGLAELEKIGLCHGDISAAGLMLSEAGGVVLLQPGLRGIVRPEEGYAHADLRPEAYDTLAVERITQGTPPTVASDIYACGCVWWHLLCGRPPLAGGDSLAKLRAAQASKVVDVRRMAPEVDPSLASAISACLKSDPTQRPESMAQLARMLGPATRSGQQVLARSARRRIRRTVSPRQPRFARRKTVWSAAVAGCVAILLGTAWLLQNARELSEQTLLSKSPSRASAGSPERSPGAFVAESSPAATKAIDPPKTVMDDQVRPTGYRDDRTISENADLVLDSDDPVDGQTLALVAGQTVRGRPGRRPCVLVPAAGLIVDQEDVCFENIDFVSEHVLNPQDSESRQAAVVHLRCARAEFRGCTFASRNSVLKLPVALRWDHPADRREAALSLPSGRIKLSDCVLRDVSTGIECQTAGALVLELTNTLHLGAGPLVALDHCPGPDEPILMALKQVTLRGCGPAFQCDYDRMPNEPGEVLIRAVRCVFMPAAEAALMRFEGPDPPRPLLQAISWTGQGSLVAPETVIATWGRSEDRHQRLDDSSVSMDGLVRGRVEFARLPGSDPAASEAVDWQAPLQSPDPPGIDPTTLPKPPI